MPRYTLYNIDEELWWTAREKAEKEGVSLKQVIERMLRQWLTQ